MLVLKENWEKGNGKTTQRHFLHFGTQFRKTEVAFQNGHSGASTISTWEASNAYGINCSGDMAQQPPPFCPEATFEKRRQTFITLLNGRNIVPSRTGFETYHIYKWSGLNVQSKRKHCLNCAPHLLILEWMVPAGRDLCLFCSLLCIKYLQQCQAYFLYLIKFVGWWIYTLGFFQKHEGLA